MTGPLERLLDEYEAAQGDALYARRQMHAGDDGWDAYVANHFVEQTRDALRTALRAADEEREKLTRERDEAREEAASFAYSQAGAGHNQFQRVLANGREAARSRDALRAENERLRAELLRLTTYRSRIEGAPDLFMCSECSGVSLDDSGPERIEHEPDCPVRAALAPPAKEPGT